MKLLPQQPNKSLNKAYLKEKVSRNDIESFKTNLKILLSKIDEKETEEHHKYPVSEFLKDTWYKDHYEINTKTRTDFVIHNGKTAKDTVGVIMEVKSPSNQSEMISEAKPNKKAMHELILYYLRERNDANQTEVKHLIITNIWEWYIFDEAWFEKNIFRSRLKKEYETFRHSGKDTKFFFDSIAKPFLDELTEPVPCAFFDFRKYETIVRNDNKKDDNKLIALYKLLSPAHLLKQPFANDSNSLDTKFYAELLHIIGLEEVKEGGKKLIQRKAKPDTASLLESAIMKLEDNDCLRNINPSVYGTGSKQQLFNVALELCITWINRVLFIKLLEGQLVTYHKGDKDHLFLNTKTIFDFDELNNLFFLVLAEKPGSRREHLKAKFRKVPYLNSSLFERTELERHTISINGLDNRLELPVFGNTVLKNDLGRKKAGKLSTLQYLFDFLDAYDFSSDGGEVIQEENKNLINASVLGLIFEKINGYKDGSFFTPGFVTMYMCRETIRRAVLQKFNEAKGWECENITPQLYDKIGDKKKEANSIINSLKICDPAVGSGHFLVSALNEIIAIKSELKILVDRQGKTLRDYHVEVVNDELVVTNEDGNLLDYNPKNKESQRIQEALFHEKETIIENCLFGVDINPNSVKICRLRLWIELLKNAYYTVSSEFTGSEFTELETLPNIDINIKCGNSLISRFALDADLSRALRKSKWNIDSYRIAVQTYRNAQSKEEKREMEELIESIKSNFRTEIGVNDPKLERKNKLDGELFNLLSQKQLFGETKAEIKTRKQKQEKLETEITKLEAQIEDIKSNKIYENAFEWRFEFPEVLDNYGNFIGFDSLIGNPPYIRQEMLGSYKGHLKNSYKVFCSAGDMFSYFYELSLNLLKKEGHFCFINNTFDKTNAGKVLRAYLQENYSIILYTDLTSVVVFEEATTYPIITLLKRTTPDDTIIQYKKILPELYLNKETVFNKTNTLLFEQKKLKNEAWNFINENEDELFEKIKKHPSLIEIFGKCYYGIKTGLNDAFITEADLGNSENINPVYEGKEMKKWVSPKPLKKLIAFKSKSTKNKYGKLTEEKAILKMQNEYPKIFEYLMLYEPLAKKRVDKGDYWWELRNCAYYDLFLKPKVIFPNLQNANKFSFDESGIYLNAPAVFLPTNEKYLLAILNSKIVWYFLTRICVVRSGGFIEVKPQYFEQIPVPKISTQVNVKLTEKVNMVIDACKAGNTSETLKLEKEIDQLVYQLYGLTEEEIKIVEGA